MPTWRAPASWLLLAGVPPGALAAPDADAIASLPGYGKPPTRHWSGFLNADDAEQGTRLHYWFAEADAPNAAELPVVLWLNGGPGSSSLLGFLQELGPLLINATGGLMQNPYAFTKQVNVLAIEAPAGVGFSYCAAMLTGGACANTDKTTAAANRAAVADFFATKFPELQKNRFYITGESYAGVYVPTLARELILNAPQVNLKGIAVGDPCTDNEAQKDSMDMLWYGHKHGFVTDSDFDLLWNHCQIRHTRAIAQGHWRRVGGAWEPAPRTASNKELSAACTVAHRRFLASTSRGFSQEWHDGWINDLTLYGPSAIVGWDQAGSLNYMQAEWLMSVEVKAALHVTDSPAKQWPGPADDWQYTSVYGACNSAAKPGTPSMVDIYREIAPRLERTIVFNGDTDPCVSYEGTRTAIEKVGFEVIDGHEYRPWFYNHTKADVSVLWEKPSLFGPDLDLRDRGVQFGGHVVDYRHNLSFITVHGSGHMVPQFRPQAAELLLTRLITGEPFAPALPTEKELEGMSDDDFDKALDTWTRQAKASVQAKREQKEVVADIVV